MNQSIEFKDRIFLASSGSKSPVAPTEDWNVSHNFNSAVIIRTAVGDLSTRNELTLDMKFVNTETFLTDDFEERSHRSQAERPVDIGS